MKKIIRLLSLTMMTVLFLVHTINAIAAENVDLGTWETKASMPTARYGLDVTEVNGKIYAIGGYNMGYLSTVEEYDPATNTWTTKANMPTSRYFFGVAEDNGKIYAIGGLGSTGVLATVEEYDPATNTWTTKANMPTARKNFGVVKVNGKIYVIGGHNNGYLSTVEEYDPATNTWTTKASMPTARYGLDVAEVNGKIYAIGGYNSQKEISTVEEYDPVTDTWTTKTNMPTARFYLSVAKAGGKVYAIGGSNDSNNSMLASVEEYDPITNTWTTKANMATAKSFFGVAEANDKIYAIGGLNTNAGINTTLVTVEIFTPPTPTINVPINLTAQPLNNQITLNWDHVVDADSYVVLRSTTSNTIDTVIASNITETTYVDNNVVPGITYYYVVRAVKSGVESTDSNVASAMIEVNNNMALLQVKLSTTDIYEYRMTMTKVDDFMNWYIARSNGTGLPFYKFTDESNIEPYTDANEYLIFDKIVWIKVKEYLM